LDAQHVARILRRRWPLILLAVALTLAGASLMMVRTTPLYVAQARLYVSSTGGEGLLAGQGDLLARSRIASYVAVADSPLVAQKVIDRLDLTLAPEQLAGEITATSFGTSWVVDLTVRDTDPERARDVANALGPELDKAVNELENITRANAVPIKVTVLRPAQLPVTPISPRPVRDLGLALALGLMLGLGAALLREVLDTRIRRDDLDELTEGVPLLGEIPYDRTARKDPIILTKAPQGRTAEAFRQLRTNLRFIDVGSTSARAFVVTSSLAGEGKSLVSCNLAIALAQSGSRVCLAETDLRRPKFSDYLGVDREPGLSNVLARQVTLDDALQSGGTEGLMVLPSGSTPPNPSELLGSAQMEEVVNELRSRFDFVLFDSPPLLPVTDAAVLARLTDGALLVVAQGRTRRQQLRRAHASLQTVGARQVGTVLNAVHGKPSDGETYGYLYNYRGPKNAGDLSETTSVIPAAPQSRRKSVARRAHEA
jgi:succinoglycan biosynthesis transport protein ExoP